DSAIDRRGPDGPAWWRRGPGARRNQPGGSPWRVSLDHGTIWFGKIHAPQRRRLPRSPHLRDDHSGWARRHSRSKERLTTDLSGEDRIRFSTVQPDPDSN